MELFFFNSTSPSLNLITIQKQTGIKARHWTPPTHSLLFICLLTSNLFGVGKIGMVGLKIYFKILNTDFHGTRGSMSVGLKCFFSLNMAKSWKIKTSDFFFVFLIFLNCLPGKCIMPYLSWLWYMIIVIKNIVQPLMQSQFQKIKNIKLKLLQKYKRDSVA